jgi:choline dehydrogenase-like flavoprotein
MRAEDFGELHHHDGLSPAWPISYQDMEPYYTAAEQFYQVHGARGEDPTDPPASAPYPYPAVSHEPRIQQLSDDLEKSGHHPFHAPCGILLNEANPPYSICVRCTDCDGFPCPLHAKSDAEVAGVRPALEHANVTLLRNARALKLETSPAGTEVTTVVVERDGETERYQGDIVVVSCGAANSAKLLLASANDKHPNGLANGSDQVGRNFMYHDSQAVLAISKEPNPTVFQKTLGVNDFYFSGPDFDYSMGNIQMIGKSQAEMYRGEKPIETKFAPKWMLRDVAEHAVDFWLSTEDLPQPDNRITLGPDGSVHISYTPSNPTAAKQLFGQLKSMVGSLGMYDDHVARRFAYMKTDIPYAGCAHQAGTVRFGADPATSVLNPDCRAHEVDNLYVVDTSFYPSISAVNPEWLLCYQKLAPATKVPVRAHARHDQAWIVVSVPVTSDHGKVTATMDAARALIAEADAAAGPSPATAKVEASVRNWWAGRREIAHPGPVAGPGITGAGAAVAEKRWPMACTLVIAMAVPLLLPARFSLGPSWSVPVVEALMLVAIIATDQGRIDRRSAASRALSLVLVAVLVADAAGVTGRLIVDLVEGGPETNSATDLLKTGFLVWFYTIIAFTFVYWALDGGGSESRFLAPPQFPGLAFPAQLNPGIAPPGWRPEFFDYLYLGFTDATAFSPTDVMPLARWAKLAMTVQSVGSLTILGLVIARAVNILQ